jgi:hypothetical protein
VLMYLKFLIKIRYSVEICKPLTALCNQTMWCPFRGCLFLLESGLVNSNTNLYLLPLQSGGYGRVVLSLTARGWQPREIIRESVTCIRDEEAAKNYRVATNQPPEAGTC